MTPLHIQRINPVAAPCRKTFVQHMAVADQINRRHVRHQSDVGMRLRRLDQRLRNRPAGGIIDMDDAAVAVAAFAGQVPAIRHGFAGVERHAQRCQPIDGGAGIGGDIFHRGAVVEPSAGDHRVFNMRGHGVARIQHSRDSALRPGGRTIGEIALGQHRTGVGGAFVKGDDQAARVFQFHRFAGRQQRRCGQIGVHHHVQHLVAGGAKQLGCFVVGHHLAVVDDGDAITQAFGFFEIMGGEHDGGAITVQITHIIPQQLPQFDVHACGRFIQHQHRRVVYQRLGHQQPALHAARKGA